ncbi:beta-lactamase/transpeptidase-like protein [Xylaria bambusicola]|uniref:beta-lactamase/transpeptidase-like protein n=1 Tax=Xylaria bambusicola TaxID=326684 RepID=UPI002007C55E|nr:beta-lactamase/transpeptidase-like protein [Xylaria bambusicola]KAI0508363.1 beta-lactamase/transpeptidase-like protein [Xylaria bambusicola]
MRPSNSEKWHIQIHGTTCFYLFVYILTVLPSFSNCSTLPLLINPSPINTYKVLHHSNTPQPSRKTSDMAEVQGHCTPQFDKVRSLLQQFIESGEEIGACIAVNVDGENVVDIWGGFTDVEAKRPWVEDTIVGIASSTKTVSSLAVLMLVDSGAISVHDKVSKYWPEFAANGKENVEIRHLLSHTSGVAGWDEKITMDEICDPVGSSAKLAAQAPWWEPGTASAYHAWNFGHMLSEIIRRVTGMSLKQYITEKITTPLSADFQLGIAEKDEPRVCHLVTATSSGAAPSFNPGPLFVKAIANPTMPPDVGSRPAWKQGEIGASNGYSNARALNKILSNITLAGSSEHKTLLSKATVDKILEEQSYGVDLAVGQPIRFGIGYAIKSNGERFDDWLPTGDIAFWGGSGGSLCIMDIGRKVTITYAMNKRSPTLIGNTASRAYIKAIYEALGVKI